MASRKITSLIFILLGFTPLLFTLYLTIQKENIFKRMKEKMETHSLQTVVISEHEVIWMDDHEIWVNEQMFDIRAKKLENGIYTFTGMYDEEETKLVKQEREAGDKSNSGSKMLTKVFKFLHGFYCESSADKTISAASPPVFPLMLSELTEYIAAIPTPPPQS